MIKQMILIAALLPASAIAHDWKQDYWIERLARNHTKIGECYDAFINNGETHVFRKSCSLHSMGYTENKLITEYRAARLHHPLMTDAEFVVHHFAEDFNLEQQAQILDNIRVMGMTVRRAMITMHIAEGLTRNDK